MWNALTYSFPFTEGNIRMVSVSVQCNIPGGWGGLGAKFMTSECEWKIV